MQEGKGGHGWGERACAGREKLARQHPRALGRQACVKGRLAAEAAKGQQKQRSHLQACMCAERQTGVKSEGELRGVVVAERSYRWLTDGLLSEAQARQESAASAAELAEQHMESLQQASLALESSAEVGPQIRLVLS